MSLRTILSTLRRCSGDLHRPFSSSPGIPISIIIEDEQQNKKLWKSSATVIDADPDPDPDPPSSPAAPDDLKSRLFRLRFPKRSATAALDKWVSEGKQITAQELRQIAKDLRKSERYKHALEISEWMKTHQEFELSDSDYAMRIELITKVFGVNAAEEFFEGLPSTAKSSESCTALLHSYATSNMIEKAEELFERIKKSNLPLSILTYNEIMTLYMSVGQLEKVVGVIEELKTQKVTPDLITYNLFLSVYASAMDTSMLSHILQEMGDHSESCTDKGWMTYMTLVKLYIDVHLRDSGNSLVESENKTSQWEWRKWITYDFLIMLQAGLGNVERISGLWKSLRMAPQKMTSRSYVCVLSSHLVLGQLKEAGEVLDDWKQSKALDFDTGACKRLYDAFVEADLVGTAHRLRELMLEKNCDSMDSFDRQ